MAVAQLINRFFKCDYEDYAKAMIPFIPKDTKGNILCLFIGDICTESTIASSLPNSTVYVADIPQFGFDTLSEDSPNLFQLDYIFDPFKEYSSKEIVECIQEIFTNKVNNMKFDYILINPPFSLGNDVAQECLKHTDNVICLMPLSKFKKGNLWSKIVDFELADPTLFQDANITPNLCITRLVPNPDKDGKFGKESNLNLESYSSDFRLVYEYNMTHSIFSESASMGDEKTLIKKGVENKTWFAISVRVVKDGARGESSWSYQWNHKRTTELKVTEKGLVGSSFYKLKSEKAKDNLTKWWHSSEKSCLANRLILGLNKTSGSCEDAIPQIDWEAIENNEYWKQGDYDSAVLDAMNLKMVDGKVVRKNIQKFEKETDYQLSSFDPDFKLVYEYNFENKDKGYLDYVHHSCPLTISEEKNINPKDWFLVSIAAVTDGVHTSEDAFDRKWNIEKVRGFKPRAQNTIGDMFYKLKSEKAKDNLTTWWYYKGKNGLADKLLKGLRKQLTTNTEMMPQIDWEAIENNEYWKNGDYDSAVLDAMNLKMVDGKVVRKNIQKFEKMEDYQLKSYDSDLRLVYEYNLEHKGTGFIKNTTLSQDYEKRGIELKSWFLTSLRAVTDGVHNSGLDYDWNHNKKPETVPTNASMNYYLYQLKSEKAKDNLTKWWYSSREKSCLANRLLWGLNKNGGSCEDAIPQIDWESVENNSYWKQGQYDEAVLDEMNLKMVDGKVVRK